MPQLYCEELYCQWAGFFWAQCKQVAEVAICDDCYNAAEVLLQCLYALLQLGVSMSAAYLDGGGATGDRLLLLGAPRHQPLLVIASSLRSLCLLACRLCRAIFRSPS